MNDSNWVFKRVRFTWMIDKQMFTSEGEVIGDIWLNGKHALTVIDDAGGIHYAYADACEVIDNES